MSAHIRRLAFAVLALTAGCNTVTRGTTQTVTIISEPSGAECIVEQGGRKVGTVSPTPGTLEVTRSSEDLRASCMRPGHRPSTIARTAMITEMLGGLSYLVDAASGANYSYPPTIRVTLPSDEATAGVTSR